MQKTWEGWQEDDGFLLSAAMAYYAAFSLFPLCLVLISILGFVLQLSQQADDAQGVLLDQVRHQAGPWLADQLQALLAGVKSNAGLGGPLGAVTLLAAAIVVFLQLDYMFGRIFGATRTASTDELVGLRSHRALRSSLGLSHAPGRRRAAAGPVPGERLCLGEGPHECRKSAPRRRHALRLGPLPLHHRDQRPAFRPDLQGLAESDDPLARRPWPADCSSRWCGSLDSDCW